MMQCLPFHIHQKDIYASFYERCKPQMDEAFLSVPKSSILCLRVLKEDGTLIGWMRYWMVEPSCVDMDILVLKVTSEDTIFGAVRASVEAITRETHCRKIQVTSRRDEVDPILKQSLFYPKGKKLQRVLEPWRYLLSDKAFDQEGFLIHQGLCKDLPFGWFNSRDKGCGWIAAYNLLKACHKEHTMKEIADALGHHAFLGEFMGQEVFSLQTYLRKEGLHTKGVLFSKKKTIAAMKSSKVGILLYTHKKGAHYTMYKMRKNGQVQFYNAVYGEINFCMTPEAFLKKYAFLPIATCIYLD